MRLAIASALERARPALERRGVAPGHHQQGTGLHRRDAAGDRGVQERGTGGDHGGLQPAQGLRVDGARVGHHLPGGQPRNQTVRPTVGRPDRRVIGERDQHDVCLTHGLTGGRRHRRVVARGHRLGLGPGPVVDGQEEAGPGQPADHGRAHPAGADDRDAQARAHVTSHPPST